MQLHFFLFAYGVLCVHMCVREESVVCRRISSMCMHSCGRREKMKIYISGSFCCVFLSVDSGTRHELIEETQTTKQQEIIR